MEEHKDLFKNFNTLKTKQQLRQQEYLIKLKDKRSKSFADNRKEIINNSNSGKVGRNRYLKRYEEFKNILMLSEWMLMKPMDIDDFLLVTCPKGTRVTLSSDGYKGCKLFYKNGQEFKTVNCHLPQVILDCIYNKDTDTIYILDIISYGGIDLADCETTFRFYWINNKFDEDQWKGSDNVELKILPHSDCMNNEEMLNCFHSASSYCGESGLDGFLFYHKLSTYIHGPKSTPLVLWTFPYMINEVFDEFTNLRIFESTKPEDYKNYMDFIQEFNSKMNMKKKRGRKSEMNEVEMEEQKLELEDMNESIENEPIIYCENMIES